MVLASLLSAGLMGIDAYPIHVEVDLNQGFPSWSTVGLPEVAVKESKDRVLSAISNSGYEFEFKRITLNLAPADVKKSGTAFDLPIAIGLLAAAELLPQREMRDYFFLGELSLTGGLRPTRGILSVAILAKQMGMKGLIVPQENAREARVIQGLDIWGARDLPEVVEFLWGRKDLAAATEPVPAVRTECGQAALLDFSEVKGQCYAKRALEVAAAGFHNIIMVGPPGTGKSMLASRLPSILPDMSFEESLTTTKIYSLLGLLKAGQSLVQERPFRSPHHTISDAGLIGGGSVPRPGEVSLAHNGVLFLDELTEFKKNVLESLRQPLENRNVTIARAMQSLTYPARFLLVAAMNPCSCGQLGNPQATCLCRATAVQKYRAKISGPLLDRMDLQIDVPPVNFSDLREKSLAESSAEIRDRVRQARDRQVERYTTSSLCSNSQMGPREIRRFCVLSEAGEKLLELAIKKWGLSARAYHRILKVSRTIADLDGSAEIQVGHLSEAIGYRSLDKRLFK